MKSYENFFETICRICLSYGNSENMVSLTDNSSKDGLSCYGKAVFIFTNIRIKNDSLPTKMCERCLFVLKQAIIFRRTCENSNENLTKCMRNFDALNTDFKEKLCDYVLFRDSFPNECLFETCDKRSEDDSLSKACMVETIRKNVYELQKRCPKVKTQLSSKPLLKIQKKDKILCRRIDRKKKQKGQHLTNEELQCKICMKVMSTSHSMLSHMERHTEGRFICEECGKKFCALAELKYHLAASHDIGAQFVCKICGFKSPKKYELMEHERIHTGERPYACDKCGLTFRTRLIWRNHAVVHKEKTIQCQQCPKKFYRRGDLIGHINSLHERLFVYSCSHCDATYAKSTTVRKHIAQKHGIAKKMQGNIRKIKLANSANVWNTGKVRPTMKTVMMKKMNILKLKE